MAKRVLVSLAHPDDESFGGGALFAALTAQGVEVTLIWKTNGDVGTVDPKFMQNYKTVPELRLAELDCAAQIIGFKEVVLFGYRDSGMMGSADNQHPDALWAAPLDQVTARVLDVMKRVKPNVVITFDPFGGYGHPDHIKTHQATVAAFHALQGQPDAPQKLYYPSIGGKSMMGGVVSVMRLLGRDPRKFGENSDMDMVEVYQHMLPAHTRIDTRAFIEKQEQASACHASQRPPSGQPLVRILFSLFAGTTRLTRAYPEPKAAEPVEHDLFARVNLPD